MRTLLTLPSEVQLMVVKYVDEKDVLTLNLTCRPLRSLLEPVIADIFGSDRTFPLSIPGMSSLLQLSMNAVTAPYLRTLIIVHPGRPQPASCSTLLTQALQNFGAFGKLHTIGVRHAKDEVDAEPDKQLAHRCIRRFLRDTMLRSAREVGLSITNVIFEIEAGQELSVWGVGRRSWMQSRMFKDELMTEVTEIMATMRASSSNSSQGIKHTLRFVREGVEGTRQSATMTYDPQGQSFHGFRLLVDDWRLTQRWLRTLTSLNAITLVCCDIEHSIFWDLAINPSLTSLSVKHARLFLVSRQAGVWSYTNFTPTYMNRHWDVVLDALRIRCQSLVYCLLGHLRSNDERMFTGPTWEARNADDVRELLLDLAWKRCSRMVFKKENAPSTGPRKPRKRYPMLEKSRSKKGKSSASTSKAQRSS